MVSLAPGWHVAVLTACALTACELERAGLGDGPRADADGSPSADAMMPTDAGRMDALPDAGSECSEVCEADDRVTCVDGASVREDCTTIRAFCRDDGAGPTCVDRVCDPGPAVCVAGDTTSSACDARGTGTTETACPRGCVAGACRPRTGCSLPIAANLSSGTMRFDTCPGGDDGGPLSGCTHASGADLLVRLEVDRRRDVRIELLAMDAMVDPLLHVRSACADQSSQIACNDDASGTTDSRLDLTLDAGDYFIFVDSYRNPMRGPPEGECGSVELVITPS